MIVSATKLSIKRRAANKYPQKRRLLIFFITFAAIFYTECLINLFKNKKNDN